MREQKFRVWDKVHDKYREPMVYDILNEKIVVRFPIETLKKGEFLLEQYTGLKDKNGKEIYEGDIVKVEDDEYTPDTNKFLGYNATVVKSILKPGAFVVKNWWGERLLQWDVKLSRVEAIGNIHENPELLGEEK